MSNRFFNKIMRKRVILHMNFEQITSVNYFAEIFFRASGISSGQMDFVKLLARCVKWNLILNEFLCLLPSASQESVFQ